MVITAKDILDFSSKLFLICVNSLAAFRPHGPYHVNVNDHATSWK